MNSEGNWSNLIKIRDVKTHTVFPRCKESLRMLLRKSYNRLSAFRSSVLQELSPESHQKLQHPQVHFRQVLFYTLSGAPCLVLAPRILPAFVLQSCCKTFITPLFQHINHLQHNITKVCCWALLRVLLYCYAFPFKAVPVGPPELHRVPADQLSLALPCPLQLLSASCPGGLLRAFVDRLKNPPMISLERRRCQ